MKNKLWMVLGIVISLVLLSNLVSAACRITFYTIDENKNLVKSDFITGICESPNQIKYIKYQAGGLFSWGGPLENCEKECGKVKINASIYDNGKLIMFGEKELNSQNTPEWNNESTKFFNLTLKYVDDTSRNSGGGNSRIVNMTQNNPTNIQTSNGTGITNVNTENTKENTESSKHLNIQENSGDESIIKDWMIYGIIGFVVVLGILAFLFFNSKNKTKEMGGKI